ncbi:reticulon-3-like [Lissotriton helveticus]
MAENATQSTHISSSHGAEASGKAGSCSGPCAELKATSFPERDTESTQNIPAMEVGVEAAPRRTPDTDFLFTSHKLSYNPFVPSEFVGSIQPTWEDALSSTGDGQLAMHGDEKESGGVSITAPAAGLKFLMLSEQEPPKKSSQKEDGLFQQSSPSTVPGNGMPEMESPSSPFEVLVGKTEFAHSSGHTSGKEDQPGKYVETEWLTKSWSSGEYGKDGAVISGGLPSGPPSYESVTCQDLDFHSLQGLSSDMLDWDISKGVKVSAEASHKCNDTSTDFKGVGLCNLSPETMEKMPLFQKDEQYPVKVTSKPEEITLLHSPQKNPGVTKKAEQLDVKSWKDEEQHPVTLQAIDNKSTGLASSTSEGAPLNKCLLDSFPLTGDSAWPDAAENADADSSGESDDTVIEDTKAVLAMAGKKEAEKIESLKVAVDPAQGVPIVSAPFTLVLVPGQGMDAEYSPEELAYHEKSKLPYAIPEEDVDFMDDFETIQAPVDSAESEYNLPKELSNQEVKEFETPYKFESQVSRMSPEFLMKGNTQSVQESEPFFLSFDKTTVSSKQLDSMCGESYMDFMKPLSTKNKDFLETHSQIKEGSAAADPTEAYTGKAAIPRKLPLSERYEDDYCIFAQAGVGAGRSSHGAKLQPSPASPEATKLFLDLDQEQLTITALRELNTIPDESPVSAEDSGSPSPKEESLLLSSNQMTEAYVCSHEYISQARPIETIDEEEADVVPVDSSSKLRKDSGLLTRGSVRDLVFWRDVKKSGVVFGTSLVMLLSLAAFSIISVVAYLILALLSVTISFRVYRSVIQAVQKSEEGHPFRPWLDVDITVSSEAFHNYMNTSLVYVNKALKKVIRLFLVEDLVDSLKLAVLMWLMTYIGAVFNGITLLILGLLLAFTVPVIYEKYQTQIDHYVSIIRDQSKAIIAKVHAKLPGLAKKKAE